jgi:hypothetical protein
MINKFNKSSSGLPNWIRSALTKPKSSTIAHPIAPTTPAQPPAMTFDSPIETQRDRSQTNATATSTAATVTLNGDPSPDLPNWIAIERSIGTNKP